VQLCGRNVKGLKEGDLVIDPFDGWPWRSEAVLDASRLTHVPQSLTALIPVEQLLANVGLSGLTALHGIRDAGKVRTGVRVFTLVPSYVRIDRNIAQSGLSIQSCALQRTHQCQCSTVAGGARRRSCCLGRRGVGWSRCRPTSSTRWSKRGGWDHRDRSQGETACQRGWFECGPHIQGKVSRSHAESVRDGNSGRVF